MLKSVIKYSIWLIFIPLMVLVGVFLFHDKQYAWISLCIVISGGIPFILTFEKKDTNTKKMLLIAVMTSVSVVGRLVFAPIPGFKPVSAMVIITAMYLGKEAGFMTGALSAVISNFYFGQGPWTPFQMFVWGLIGLLAGIFEKKLKQNRWFLYLYGIFAGVIFSLLMDIWTVLWWDGTFHLKRYLAAIISAGGYTVVYAVSNVVFLLLAAKPIGEKLERIKCKYGI